MAARKWLNIVVDGNAALQPYWSEIVSEHLEKIVRCFMGNYTREEAYLGLVLYNAYSDLGFDVQFLGWTRDIQTFLEIVSCIPFRGENQIKHAMVEGLAEALTMFPRPSDTMTTQEYYNGQRHCILVAAGEPVPRRMLVSVPVIQESQVVGSQLQTCMADFLEVAHLFSQLDVSLSLITPNPLPIFAAIFNLGNNDSSLAYNPSYNYRFGQFTILLSRNFQEAHNALRENRIVGLPANRSVESMNTTALTTLPRVASSLQEDQSSACEVTIGDRISEANTGSIKSQLVFPNATDQNVASSSSQSLNNVFDDILADLNAGQDIYLPSTKSNIFTTLEEDNLKVLFQPDQFSSDDINNSLGQEQTMSTEKNTSMGTLLAFDTEHEPVLRDNSLNISGNQISIIDLTSNSSKGVDISPLVASTSNTGEGSSTGLMELRGKESALSHNLSSENYSDSALLLPQQHPSTLWPAGPEAWYPPHGMMSTAVRLGIVDPWNPPQFPTDASLGNAIVPQATGNSFMQSQQYSPTPSQPPVFPNAINQYSGGLMGNLSGQPVEQHCQGYQYQRDHITGFGPLNKPAMAASTWVPPVPGRVPTRYLGQFLPPPSLSDFGDSVITWEGTLAGKILSNRVSITKAKAFRKATSDLGLTIKWSRRLEICNFVPQKAIDHTKNISYGPIEYVFFQIVQSKSFDLSQHLKSQNLCAKIDMPCQFLILSPTEDDCMFLGTVFPGDTLFVEPI